MQTTTSSRPHYLQVCDEHAELCTPVPQVVDTNNIVAQEL